MGACQGHDPPEPSKSLGHLIIPIGKRMCRLGPCSGCQQSAQPEQPQMQCTVSFVGSRLPSVQTTAIFCGPVSRIQTRGWPQPRPAWQVAVTSNCRFGLWLSTSCCLESITTRNAFPNAYKGAMPMDNAASTSNRPVVWFLHPCIVTPVHPPRRQRPRRQLKPAH